MTITSSDVHMSTPFKEKSAPNILHRLDEKAAFPKPPDRYHVSKLLNVLWTRELASKVKVKEIIINTVNPGLCHSSLHRDNSSAALKYVKKVFARTTDEGGRTIVDAAAVQDEDARWILERSKDGSVRPSPLDNRGHSCLVCYCWRDP